jgi:hypothetical protein
MDQSRIAVIASRNTPELIVPSPVPSASRILAGLAREPHGRRVIWKPQAWNAIRDREELKKCAVSFRSCKRYKAKPMERHFQTKNVQSDANFVHITHGLTSSPTAW